MEKKGVGRPRDGDPEETKREILRAAEHAFAGSGFSGATTRQIAGEAHVNVATLHYHFGGKKGLYRAVMAEVSRGDLPTLAAAGSPRERLRLLAGELFEFSARRVSLSRLALLDDLAGPSDASAGVPPEDPRIGVVSGALNACRPVGGSAQGVLPVLDAARLIVRLIDVALVPERDGTGEAWPSRGLDLVRESVAEAALRIAGVA